MKHYHDYQWDCCSPAELTHILRSINESGYKLISVTETTHGYSSYYTLFYDRNPETKEN